MKKLIIFTALLVIPVISGFAQVKNITGVVTSSEGPLAGVSVVVKGTTSGTSTDQNGKYSISANVEAVLIFSFIGMKTAEVSVGERSQIDLQLEKELVSLDEVVVTSAYSIKQSARSASTLNQVIPAEKISEIRQIDINSALSGKVAGFQFLGGSSAKLDNTSYARLRGASGFGTGNRVIYVVDGTVLQDASGIDVDNIENVNVLSGPAASAILGSQGSDGAIIINTKNARSVPGKETDVEINSGLFLTSVSLLPQYQNEYAGGSSYEMYTYKYRPGDPEEWKSLDGKQYPDYSLDVSWGPKMEGQEYIPWYAWYPGTNYTGKTASLIPQPDNVKDFYETGIIAKNNISFSRKGEGFSIYSMIGNEAVRGNIPGTSRSKNSFSVRTTVDLSRKFVLGANLNYSAISIKGDFNDRFYNQTSSSFNANFHRDLDMGIMKELRDLRSCIGTLATWNHGNPLDSESEVLFYDVQGNPASYDPENPLPFYGATWNYNFYTYLDYVKRIKENRLLFGDISLIYKIINNLDFKITYRRQESTIKSEDRYSSDLSESSSGVWFYPLGGAYSTASGTSIRENFESLISFKKDIQNISANINAGTDFFSSSIYNISAGTKNGLAIRNLFSLANSRDKPDMSEQILREKYRAVFLRGDIGYKKFLFADFTLRNDWFSTLRPDANSVLSKSIGASFIYSGLLKYPWLDFGKFRLSWGEIPVALSPYIYPGTSSPVEALKWNNNILMSTNTQLVDQGIKGEVKTQREIGLDLRVLKNLYLSATYWDGSEKGIPYGISVSGYSGYTKRYLNTGKISKKGLDLTLSARPVSLSGFSWDFNTTFSYLIKNKILFIADSIRQFTAHQSGWGGNSPDLVHAAGHTWGELMGAGIKMYNNKPVLDSNGYYVQELKSFGSVLPKITGGIQNSFRFLNNFFLSVNFDYQVGGKYFSISELCGAWQGNAKKTAGLNDLGNPIRDPVSEGGGVHVYGVDEIDLRDVDYFIDARTYFENFVSRCIYEPYVNDLSFLKLREVSLSYNLPVNKIQFLQKHIQSMVFTVMGQNLWLMNSEKYSFDPSEISYVLGEDGQFPSFRMIGGNIKAIF